jgi:hypothetical protein
LHREYGPAVEFADGTKCWYKNGKPHREDGPAYECANGDKSWCLEGTYYSEKEFLIKISSSFAKTAYEMMKNNNYVKKEFSDKICYYLNGKYHREDGPAIEYVNGNKFWYKNGKQHREDGPAVEYTNGTKYWYKNGKLHREKGPAIECVRGDVYWYLNGISYSEKEYNKIQGNKITVIQQNLLISNKIFCKNCNQFNEYATPNQSDGSYICYNCR